MQKYTSKLTSINTIPTVFKSKYIQPYSLILDYGGGKFNTTTLYLADKHITNLVYDPFNRSELHNQHILNSVKEMNGVMCTVCANVLCVIQEDNVILEILKDLNRYTKVGGLILIQIYEGNKSGVGSVTTKGYQRNQKTNDYLYLIEMVFDKLKIKRKGNLIIIEK